MKEKFQSISKYLFFVGLAVFILLVPFRRQVGRVFVSCIQMIRGRKTVNERVSEFAPIVKKRLEPDFKELGMAYPPSEMVLICLKEEKLLEVWGADENRKYRLLKKYPILGASGTLGPKLKEGDGQVPEGIYEVENLNPNSLFHLSIRLNYPNSFDRKMGKAEGRNNLGSDIMIHGNTCSVGCLAMGDKAAEDLFVLTALTGPEKVKVIISPIDFRNRRLEVFPDKSEWVKGLYQNIEAELKYF